MKVSVIGTGYVGLSTGVGFAVKGNHVICMDVDEEKLARIKSGDPVIFEPGLEEALREVLERELFGVTNDLDYALKNSEVSLISVPTPPKKDGSIGLKHIEEVSKQMGKSLKAKDYHVIVVKSSVVPQTTERVVIPNLEEFSGKGVGDGFGVCMNPEFLREGSALQDFLEPDRIVIGEYDKRSGDALAALYQNFRAPVLRTDLKTAEFIKYASNAFLATKVSFSNELGNIAKRLGVDIYEVMKGVGLDKRISPHFLRAGIGYGGSCFPKDILALISKASGLGYDSGLLKEVDGLNRRQPLRMVDLLRKRTPLKGRAIAVLGLAFKPETDDVRDAPSLIIVRELLRNGANVKAYDPKATGNFRKHFPKINYATSPQQALRGSDACLVLTEWEEFKSLEDKDFGEMKSKIIIEGRKALNPNLVSGFEGVCW